jgi:hypothetical protein
LEIVEQGNFNAISAESNLNDKIVLAQLNDEGVQLTKQKLAEEDPKYSCFRKDARDVVWFEQCLVVPVDPELRKEISDEAHRSKLSIHPGSTKNVSRFEEKLLVVKHEDRHSQICGRV